MKKLKALQKEWKALLKQFSKDPNPNPIHYLQKIEIWRHKWNNAYGTE